MDGLRSLREGDRVEVRQKDVGLRGSWHPATIVFSRAGRHIVEYDELLTDDGLNKLRESIACPKLAENTTPITGVRRPNKSTAPTESPSKRRGFLRPSPPICMEPAPLTWKCGLYVDVFYQDAWWEAVLLNNVTSLDNGELIDVIYPDEGDQARVHAKDMRISQHWDEVTGKWSTKGSANVTKLLRRRGIARQKGLLTIKTESQGSETSVIECKGWLQTSFASPKGRLGGSMAHGLSCKNRSKKSLPVDAPRGSLFDCVRTDTNVSGKALQVGSSSCSSGSCGMNSLEISKTVWKSEETLQPQPLRPKSLNHSFKVGCNQTKSMGANKEASTSENTKKGRPAPSGRNEFDVGSKRRRLREAPSENFFSPRLRSSATTKDCQTVTSIEKLHSGNKSSVLSDAIQHRGQQSSRNHGARKLFRVNGSQQSLECVVFGKGASSTSPRHKLDCQNSHGKSDNVSKLMETPKKCLLALEAPVLKSRKELLELMCGESSAEKSLPETSARSRRRAQSSLNTNEVEDTLRSFKDSLLRRKQDLKRKTLEINAQPDTSKKVRKLLTSKSSSDIDRNQSGIETEGKTLKGLAREIGIKAILEAGYTIEYRPRKGNVHLDAVYISPKGSSHWSLPRAWQALAPGERRGRVKAEKAVVEAVFSKIDSDKKLRAAFLKLDRYSGTCIKEVVQKAKFTNAGLTDLLLEDLGVLRKVMQKLRKDRKDSHSNNSVAERRGAKSKDISERLKGKLSRNRPPPGSKKLRSKLKEHGMLLRQGPQQALKHFKSSKDWMHLRQGPQQALKQFKSQKDWMHSRQGSRKTSYNMKCAKAAPFEPVSFTRRASMEKSTGKMANFVSRSSMDKGSRSTPKGGAYGNRPERVSKQESSRKKQKNLKVRSGIRLEVRPSLDDESDEASSLSKRTIISWMIDRGVLVEKERIFNVGHMTKKLLKEGVVTREGILCRCCKNMYTVQSFQEHGGIDEEKQHGDLLLTSGRLFTDCKLDTWNAELRLRETKNVKGVTVDDSHDDTCLLCGDGGDLICCDLCPSTFHVSCLELNNVPEGKWFCPKCLCGVCKGRHQDDEELAMEVCSQCEHRYHIACLCGGHLMTQKEFFCGNFCKKIFWSLRERVGFTQILGKGISWTLLHCTEGDYEPQSKAAIDNNSKLAVALLVLKECFNPMDDPRTNVDMITHAVYNRWSQFDRLKYTGFYTAVLERDDEIISVASIRIHGARLAEMPLIGTRHKYRRQGMCRLLVGVIEKLLSSLDVATFILPAIPDLFETWTKAFEFQPLDASQRSGIKNISMMTFPGTDLLQKALLPEGSMERACSLDCKSGELHMQHADDAGSMECASLLKCESGAPEMQHADDDAMLRGSVECAPCESAALQIRHADDGAVLLGACVECASSLNGESPLMQHAGDSSVLMEGCMEHAPLLECKSAAPQMTHADDGAMLLGSSTECALLEHKSASPQMQHADDGAVLSGGSMEHNSSLQCDSGAPQKRLVDDGPYLLEHESIAPQMQHVDDGGAGACIGGIPC